MKFDFTKTKTLKATLYFNNILIEQPIRSFIKSINQAEVFNRWLLLHRLVKYAKLIKDIDWDRTWKCFAFSSYNKQSETSFSESKIKAFKIKIMNNNLPVLENLKIRRPDLYGNGWTCISCRQENETQQHLWLCNNNQQMVKEIIEKCKKYISEKIKSLKHYNNKDHNINKILSDICWDPYYDEQKITFLDLINGIIPKSLTNNIYKITCCNESTTNITNIIMETIIINIYKDIWKPRCELVIQEEIKENITKRMKLKKENKKKKKEKIKKKRKDLDQSNPINETYLSISSWISWVDSWIKIGNQWEIYVS